MRKKDVYDIPPGCICVGDGLFGMKCDAPAHATLKVRKSQNDGEEMSKPLVAEQRMQEFDPECERHFPVLIVKIVDPGCTLELQIENCVDGTVKRISSTEDPQQDLKIMLAALKFEFVRVWNKPIPGREA